MIFTPVLSKVKVAIELFDKNIMRLDNIPFRSGQEQNIWKFIFCIREAQLSSGLIEVTTPNGESIDEFLSMKIECTKEVKEAINVTEKQRDIFLLLLLNTKATYKYNLVDVNIHVTHVLNETPQLPMFLLMPTIRECALSDYFQEFIALAPTWMTTQFIEGAYEDLAAIRNLYTRTVASINLIRAMAYNIWTYLTFFKIKSTSNISLIKNLVVLAPKFLHIIDENEKFNKMSKENRQYLRGLELSQLLSLTSFIMRLYQSGDKFLPTEVFFKVYAKFQCSNMIKDRVEKQIQYRNNLLQKLLKIVCDKVEVVVKTIDIDTFLEWEEFTVPNGNNLFYTNMQEYVCVFLDYMLTDIKEMPFMSNHTVTKTLTCFNATKPKPLGERIDRLSKENLLSAIKLNKINNAFIGLFLNSLLKKPGAIGNMECLQVIETKCLSYFDLYNCKLLLRAIATEMECITEPQMKERIINILHTAYSKLKLEDKQVLLCFKSKWLDTMDLARPDFARRLTKFILICNPMDIDLSQFLDLCFENAIATWEKLHEQAIEIEFFTKCYLETVKRMPCNWTTNCQLILLKAVIVKCDLRLFTPQFYRIFRIIYIENFNEDNYADITECILHNLVIACNSDDTIEEAEVLVKLLLQISNYNIDLPFGKMTMNLITQLTKLADQIRGSINIRTFRVDKMGLVASIRTIIKKTVYKFNKQQKKNGNEIITGPTFNIYGNYSLPLNVATYRFNKFLPAEVIKKCLYLMKLTTCEIKEFCSDPSFFRLLSHNVANCAIIANEYCTYNSLDNYIYLVKAYLNVATITGKTKKLNRLKVMLRTMAVIFYLTPDIYEELYELVESCLLKLVDYGLYETVLKLYMHMFGPSICLFLREAEKMRIKIDQQMRAIGRKHRH